MYDLSIYTYVRISVLTEYMYVHMYSIQLHLTYPHVAILDKVADKQGK